MILTAIIFTLAFFTSFYTMMTFIVNLLPIIAKLINGRSFKANFYGTALIGILTSILWGVFYYLTH